MDNKLLWTGLWNSGLLTVSFLSMTVQSLAGGSVLFGLVGAAATYFTAQDAIKFYNAYKASKES